MFKRIKTYLSRRQMRLRLQSQLKDIRDIVNEMQLCRDRYLKSERVGSNEKNYYKGWYEALKWVVGEEKK